MKLDQMSTSMISWRHRSKRFFFFFFIHFSYLFFFCRFLVFISQPFSPSSTSSSSTSTSFFLSFHFLFLLFCSNTSSSSSSSFSFPFFSCFYFPSTLFPFLPNHFFFLVVYPRKWKGGAEMSSLNSCSWYDGKDHKTLAPHPSGLPHSGVVDTSYVLKNI